MSLQLGNITFDCADALRVATFWSAVLGRPLDEGSSDAFASIGRGDDAHRPAWLFIRVPEAKAAKNRVHVDLSTDDRDGEVARILALGAERQADHDEWGIAWTVLTDPEGNEFCVG
jgi:hypothetical protein